MEATHFIDKESNTYLNLWLELQKEQIHVDELWSTYLGHTSIT